MALLEFREVYYMADGKTILENISLLIDKSDYLTIVGPSGCGKSTLLKLCNQLISPTKGEIFYKERNLTELEPTQLRKSIAYCPQSACLFGETVLENLSFPYSIRNLKPDREKIAEWLDKFGMSGEFLNKGVKNLSGGEKQRIALIRTLLFMPEILLLDEITSALDSDNAKRVEDIIETLNHQGIAILWITHNAEQSRRHARKIVTIEAGRIKSVEVLK